jgi:hypothetical protein
MSIKNLGLVMRSGGDELCDLIDPGGSTPVCRRSDRTPRIRPTSLRTHGISKDTEHCPGHETAPLNMRGGDER